VFSLFAGILPFVFIAWRYQIFNVAEPKVSLTGWGFIGVVILFLFIVYMYNVAKKIFKYSLFFQIVSGFIKVILPILVVYIVVDNIENNIHLFKQALMVVILCELVAIIVNPFPKYMYENNIENITDIIGLGIKKGKGV